MAQASVGTQRRLLTIASDSRQLLPWVGMTNGGMIFRGPPPSTGQTPSMQVPRHGWRSLFGLLTKPVLSPIAIPAIITPIGVVALFYYAAATVEDPVFQRQILFVLVQIVTLNLAAMIFAGGILKLIGLPVLQAVGWVMSSLQAALAVQIVIGALRRLHPLP